MADNGSRLPQVAQLCEARAGAGGIRSAKKGFWGRVEGLH
jgi:hypothetical protein